MTILFAFAYILPGNNLAYNNHDYDVTAENGHIEYRQRGAGGWAGGL